MPRRVGLNDRLKKEKEVTTRPMDALIRPKEELTQENKERYMSFKEATRKTFLLDPISIEALRIFTFKTKKGLSETILEMLLKYIPKDVWVEARNNVIDFEETPADYLDNVELTIDNVYYHGE